MPDPAPPPPGAAPSIASITPAGTYAGTGGFPVTVTGNGFVAASTVQWEGANLQTTFVSSTQLQAQLLGSHFANPGRFSMRVVNPASGGTSNTVTFTVAPGPEPGTGVIELISVATDGTPSNGNTFTPPAISADGRYVAFQSDATNLVPGPASGFSDIYVRDTCLGALGGCTAATIRVSVATDGTLANGNSRTPSISADGRFVAFDSSASNLVLGDTNNNADVFVRDTCIGGPPGCAPATTRVSVASDGTQGDFGSRAASISADGRFVAFSSGATNLVAGGSNLQLDVYVRDRCFGAAAGCSPSTFLISAATDGTRGDRDSALPSITADGCFVTFLSFATNLIPNDTNDEPDSFVRDTCFEASAGCTPTTSRVSVATDSTQGNDSTDNSSPSPIRAEGRFVAFTSFATNLVPGDTNQRADVFIRDTCVNAPGGCTPSTRRVSVAVGDAQADNGSHEPSISSDGRLVVFSSLAFNLIPGGSSAPKHVYLRDTCSGAPEDCIPTTILLSMTSDSFHFQGDGLSDFPAISTDGQFVVFRSTSTNLIPSGSNGNLQVFLARTGH